jgi:peptidoglycan/LPS O-acetylase OafA/YrhL
VLLESPKKDEKKMLTSTPVVRRYGDTDFVTALRAIAATLVVIVHTGAFAEFGQMGQNLVSVGKFGVQVFFVISGFSIATTFATASSYKEFLTRRLFRIVPLYWLMILVVSAFVWGGLIPANEWSSRFNAEINSYNVLMHLSFLSCLDHRVGATILGVEWTIPVEMFWYGLLPVLITFADTYRRLIQVIVLSVLGGLVTQLIARFAVSIDHALFAKWFPTTHGPCFLLGVLAYRLRQSSARHPERTYSWRLAAAWLLAITLAPFGAPGRGTMLVIATILTISFFRGENFPRICNLVTARPLLFIGSVSYSLYLVHFPVALFLKSAYGLTEGLTLFIACYAISVLLSFHFYMLVEIPMNNLGKMIASRTRELRSVGSVAPESIENVVYRNAA